MSNWFNKISREYFRNKKSIFYFDTYGNIAIASLLICAVSGILLAVPYDVENAYDSIAMMLLTDPASNFIRSIHYWSAQFFLIFSIIHIWDHFRKKTENKVKKGVWLRLTISILFLFYVMLSGFIIKGDAESLQAMRILTALFEEIPIVGNLLASTFIGPEGDFELLYVHHVATATIFLIIVTFEHAKTIWTRYKTALYTLIITIIFSFIWTPSLHDNLNPIVKGPWYFLGLQEILHWITSPIWAIILTTLFFVVIWYIPKVKEEKRDYVKNGIVAAFLVYFVLTLFGYFFRGENWEFTYPWNNPYLSQMNNTSAEYFPDFSEDEISLLEIPVVLDRKEGCLTCHNEMSGFTASHNPEAVGCASCHLGNVFTLNKDAAHEGMILIPGDLKTAELSCETTECHPEITERVPKSIMSTLSGMVSVNRFVFDELDTPTKESHIELITKSPADSHLRDLCASCHLGNIKEEWGPINQLSRGGGCVACHLSYDSGAVEQLDNYLETKNENTLPKLHPQLNINISNDNCFGCHSRSGRIATNYEGWNETLLTKDDYTDPDSLRLLEDGRAFKFVKEDIHHAKGIDCIDCHNSYELMGDGNVYLHKEDQVKIECVDCHLLEEADFVKKDKLDSEQQKIYNLRKYEHTSFLKKNKTGKAILNTYERNDSLLLVIKNDEKELPLKPPAFVCTEGKAHSELSCNTCHTSWAPQCIGCHTEYDPETVGFDLLENKETKGAWIEHVGLYLAEPPVLGVKEKNGERKVDTFIPGMILSIDESKHPQGDDEITFKRLYSPAFSHTIVIESRDCKSCHNDPLAIGYGRGKLEYVIDGENGKWKFTPKYQNNKYDGLPEDAWIEFLQERNDIASTREYARPFNLEEQKNILTAGACLTCHKDDSKVMKDALYDFEKSLRSVSEKCVFPSF